MALSILRWFARILAILIKLTMKTGKKFSFVPEILGIIVTAIMVLTLGVKLIIEIIEDGEEALREIYNALFHWRDDPTAFFIFYIIGYIIVWWRPLWGSFLIIIASLLVALVNLNNIGFVIFAIPTLLVGFFYFESWNIARKSGKLRN